MCPATTKADVDTPADPCTTIPMTGARQNLDRHPNYILAAYMASGTLRRSVSRDMDHGKRPALPK